MTFYEHAMLGGTLALAPGAQRRHGWPVVLMAGLAAPLPDWAGRSLALGPLAYASVLRVWGHNLLAAALAGGLTGCLALLCQRSAHARKQPVLPAHELGPAPAVQSPPL